MTSSRTFRVGAACALGLIALDLAACGKQGGLDRPGPLFGQRRSEARPERDAGLSTAAISAAPHAPPNPDTPAAGAAPAPQ